MHKSLQHAEVQLFQASMMDGPARAALLAEARDALIRAETLEKGCGAWLLACISALEGNRELCRRWLERARKHEALPPQKNLETAPYLESVREEKWFRRLLREIEE